ncbi:iron dicitrate transporter FecR [Bacteroidia bacterium]|nr:iron dicitrate transporter FecR [Bacteroidia bacterium]
MEKDQIKKNILMANAIDDDISEYKLYNVDAAYQNIQKRIGLPPKKQKLMNFMLHIAAVLLFPLLTSTITLSYLYMKDKNDIVYYTVQSAPGIVSQMELPDKSKVWLNAGSTLRYPSHFTNKERVVYLDGEGYFEVKSDIENPFFVIANHDVRVKAFGTKFNVRSYTDDSGVEATLESGAINVIFNNQSISLHPNEIINVDTSNGNINYDKDVSHEKTAWKDGRLLFRNTPLAEVIKSLSRRYNVDIEIQGSSSIEYKFRASFTTETIMQVLDYLKMAAPIEWSFVDAHQQNDFSYTRPKIAVILK